MTELDELYQAIILDHNKRPRHYGALAGATHRADGYNPICGDKVSVELIIRDERIEAMGFESASCAICKASASLMTEALAGRSVTEADAISRGVQSLLEGTLDSHPDAESELNALSGVRKFPARIKCADLPWQTFVKAYQQPMRSADDSCE